MAYGLTNQLGRLVEGSFLCFWDREGDLDSYGMFFFNGEGGIGSINSMESITSVNSSRTDSLGAAMLFRLSLDFGLNF